MAPELHDEDDLRLFEALRSRRLELAREQSVPPYVVFHDRTLVEMALRRPGSRAALLEISGVGDVKLERYGDVFLDVIHSQVEPTDKGPAP